MSTVSADYLDAIMHLPSGGRLVFYDVPWDSYERLLEQLGDKAHCRISYDHGRLEIMSPSQKHEKYKNLIHDLVLILSDELGQEIHSYGSATFKQKLTGKGVEPDDCFYIQHAGEIGGKDNIDLDIDPAPDLIVEIDVTRDSSSRFEIYSTLGVPEIWRFDGDTWQIFSLTGDHYVEQEYSLAFPFLSANKITEFITASESSGPNRARQAFREWLKENKPR